VSKPLWFHSFGLEGVTLWRGVAKMDVEVMVAFPSALYSAFLLLAVFWLIGSSG